MHRVVFDIEQGVDISKRALLDGNTDEFNPIDELLIYSGHEELDDSHLNK